ncbi:hypothetical protein AVEN_40553-1 [Araneus ventricosus]|uniref:Mos1 transposase HTH domain-containing protein n=1 Tax=Araneus ventricosus TaxID=182803 RepID=A0A4Y2M929_ARAVE|nr:hypothetical protein AVEN_40553-1 [Araneus ventricosus]
MCRVSKRISRGNFSLSDNQSSTRLGSCKWHAVIRLWAKRCNCIEIYRQLHEVSDENAMSRQAIAKWCNKFENGLTDINDAESEGRPSTARNSEIAAHVNDSILANRPVAVDEIANKLDISHGSAHTITVKHLEFNKVYA